MKYLLCSPIVAAELASETNTRKNEVILPKVLHVIMTRISVSELVHLM